MPEIKNTASVVTCTVVDQREEGDLCLITLKNREIAITLTNYGCIITSIVTPSKTGALQNIVAGYTDFKDYERNEHYFGCLLGRYANRIAGGRFVLDGQTYQLSQNNGVNHLHGGFVGFSKQLFSVSALIEEDGVAGVELEYFSKDGEEGYPGNLQVKVRYTLNEKNQLQLNYQATTDKATPVNLAEHSYFNLSGFDVPDARAHTLMINADAFTETAGEIPTGKIIPVAGTLFNFTTPRSISANNKPEGYNQNFVVRKNKPDELVLAAILAEETSGRTLKIYTDQPGLQLYTANVWDGAITGSQGKPYQQFGAVALEAQHFPDGPNHANFPPCILYPGEVYRTTTIYEFNTDTHHNQSNT